MNYVVVITTRDGNTITADDTVVERQGTAAYNQICRKEDVLIKDSTGHIIFVPYVNIVKADISEASSAPVLSRAPIYQDYIATSVSDDRNQAQIYGAALVNGANYVVEFGDDVYELVADTDNDLIYIGGDENTPFVIEYNTVDYNCYIYTDEPADNVPIAIYVLYEESQNPQVILEETTVETYFMSNYYGAVLVEGLEESPIIPGHVYKAIVNEQESIIVCSDDRGIAGNIALVPWDAGWSSIEYSSFGTLSLRTDQEATYTVSIETV